MGNVGNIETISRVFILFANFNSRIKYSAQSHNKQISLKFAQVPYAFEPKYQNYKLTTGPFNPCYLRHFHHLSEQTL
ncbi:hypothetical protein BpHYR1_050407 [Brachionus plicatilis]|uniref:Uncharacterized protein n=1 Tax=Brachionus plicatilis TaxID=10195 RepID=A0A3M7SBT5_BRAPC|nr:hypothetical protein BpHYR1_050407 [Brachionus plicatilis]